MEITCPYCRAKFEPLFTEDYHDIRIGSKHYDLLLDAVSCYCPKCTVYRSDIAPEEESQYQLEEARRLNPEFFEDPETF